MWMSCPQASTGGGERDFLPALDEGTWQNKKMGRRREDRNFTWEISGLMGFYYA